MAIRKPRLSNLVLNIIEGVSDGILIQNEEGEILFFNDVLLELTGWSSHYILSHPDEVSLKLGLEGFNGDQSARQVIQLEDILSPFEVIRTLVETPQGNYYLISLKGARQSSHFESYRLHYEQLFNNIGDSMFTADLNGNIITANPAFFSMFGYKEARHTLPNLNQMYVYRDELDEKIRRLVQDNGVFNMETHLYDLDHNIKRVLDTSWVIRNTHGQATGYAAQFKDVTYLRNIESRLKISERNFTILFDTILSSIVVLDEDGKILNLNSAAEKVYQYSWEELVGEHYDSLLRVGGKGPRFAKIKRLIHDGEDKYIESEIARKRKDREIIYTYAVYSAIRNSEGKVFAYSLVEKDLTERIHLENKLRESFEEIKETQSAAIIGFAKLTEYRDKDTGKHLERIREFTRIMALTLRALPKYQDYITDEYLEDLTLSSILHDVGKVGIEDKILLKPGRLTAKEFDLIKRHVQLGGEALEVVDQKLNKKSFLTMGKEIARYHHERWDGNGYPEGLKGEEIPLSARIVAIADVYDALVSKRPYKEACSHEEAVQIIADEKGKQFDPEIVDAFLQNHPVFERIRKFIEFEQNPESISALLDTIEQRDSQHSTGS
ncbi:MAG: HD domain-containing phosphohydrolase [Sediminispirochaetaceae bacterium]